MWSFFILANDYYSNIGELLIWTVRPKNKQKMFKDCKNFSIVVMKVINKLIGNWTFKFTVFEFENEEIWIFLGFIFWFYECFK